MDIERILIYGGIGIAYYLYKQFFKNFGTSTTKKESVPTSFEPQAPTQDRTTWNVPPPPQAEKQPSIFDLLEDLKKQEAQQKAKTETPKTIFYTNLEETNYEAQPNKAPLETVNPYQYKASESAPEKIPASSFAFAEYVPKRSPHPILKLFKDKSKVKEAFILSEILTKRY
jgi:hypothetical protein